MKWLTNCLRLSLDAFISAFNALNWPISVHGRPKESTRSSSSSSPESDLWSAALLPATCYMMCRGGSRWSQKHDMVVLQESTFFSREPSFSFMSFTAANSICIWLRTSALNWCNSLRVCTWKPMHPTQHETCTTEWRVIPERMTCDCKDWKKKYTWLRRFLSMHWLFISIDCSTLLNIVVRVVLILILVMFRWTLCAAGDHVVARSSLSSHTIACE